MKITATTEATLQLMIKRMEALRSTKCVSANCRMAKHSTHAVALIPEIIVGYSEFFWLAACGVSPPMTITTSDLLGECPQPAGQRGVDYMRNSELGEIANVA